jgi:hypothetical protein
MRQEDIMAFDSKRSGGGLRSLVTTTLVIVLVLVVGMPLLWRWLGTPFSTTKVDRSAPPVLVQLRDLAEYHAASGDFEVLVDVEKDVSWLPSALAGERVFFVGVGSVDAMVDFTTLGDEAVQMNDERTEVTINLPAPTLGKPVVDPSRSEVANRDRGLINRLSGIFTDNPTSETELYLLAGEKMGEAATASDLQQRAEDNTRNMLYSLMKSLGFEKVNVRFVESSSSSSGTLAP